MKNLFILSTEIGVGKGGISTALVGYIQSNYLNKQFNVIEITSHRENRRLRPMLIAIYKLLNTCKKGDIVWLHCGPWLSMVMKFTLGVVAKLKGAKIVIHLHSATVDSYLNVPWKTKILTRFLDFSDKVIVLTPWWKKRLLSKVSNIEGKVEVSGNPVDQNILNLASSPILQHESNSTVNLLSMSRLTDGKGFESVIEALVNLPEKYKLTIAGDGPLFQKLIDKTVDLGVDDRVQFLGWINYDDKLDVLKSHDVFVLPSKHDSFGMGFIEAMAAGLPVVALDYQAIPDVVPHKVAGFLSIDGSAQNLTNAVLDCVNNQAEYGVAGKVHVLNNFDNEVISNKLIKILDSLDK